MAITGYGRDEDRELAREAGLADYLMKPVDFEKLRRTLAELLRAREATGTVAPE